ncbi:hypothetical protein BGW80DRAFT_1298131, partial [Lactifluus volemus]
RWLFLCRALHRWVPIRLPILTVVGSTQPGTSPFSMYSSSPPFKNWREHRGCLSGDNTHANNVKPWEHKATSSCPRVHDETV